MPVTTEIREENKLDLAAEVLRGGGAIRLQALGTSMLPSIWPGDILSIESTSGEEAVPGDIVLVQRDPRFFIHRLIEKHSSHWTTRGDSMPQNDEPVAASQVLGKVSAIQRINGTLIPVPRLRPVHRAFAAALCHWDSFRNLVLRCRSILVAPPSRRRLRSHWQQQYSPCPNRQNARVARTSMTLASQAAPSATIAIEIGGMAIALRTQDPTFRQLLENRYTGFIKSRATPEYEFDIDLFEPQETTHADEDVQVTLQNGQWLLQRGDFRARWDATAGHGHIRQSRNPYAIDSVLRIVHTLILAKQGGFLVHAASAIRNRRAFLFAGVSGAGKTTISRLAPLDATLLTDEISYVRRDGDQYRACGTPFAGELARVGENLSAPLSALFLLEKGPENRIEPVPTSEAIRLLMRNILFFAEDAELVNLVFRSACEFVERVPIRRLIFVPDKKVWEIIGLPM